MPLQFADARFMLLLAADAFEAAYGRWEEARRELDEAVAFGPLAECLWWSVSLDERLFAIEGQSYRSRRDADQDGV